jgi:tRNA nucleotidyltransferase/poly(A) polymerase
MKLRSIRDIATDIVRRLQKAGHSAFWVGGCVRDSLLGREPDDYDIASSATPEEIESLFKKTIPVGRKFGVMIVVEEKHEFQVAMFRAEAEYTDGRRPGKVVFSDARADALRRDFTANGLFFDPIAKQLHDWVGGEVDLKARVIRTIGSPLERFAEDHLRMLRAVRFAVQLGFEIEPATFAAIKANASKIVVISAERIRDELMKLFAPQIPGRAGSPLPAEARQTEDGAHGVTRPTLPAARGLQLLHESGLLPPILPELAATITCEQSPDYHPEGTVFEHLKLMLAQMPADAHPLLPWAVLMHDIAKPLTASRDAETGSIHFYEHEKIGAEMAVTILERLRFPRKQIEEVADAVRYHMQFKDAPKMRQSTLRRMLMRDTFPLELQLHRLDCLGSHGRLDVYDFLVEQAEALKKQPTIHPPLLTGKDLIKLGVKPGPAMGKLLAELREKQLQDELKTKKEARAWVRSNLQAQS